MTKDTKTKPTEVADAHVDPVLYEPEPVTIAGREYSVRRLGLGDVFKVARILGRGVSMLTNLGDKPDPGTVVQIMVAAMANSEEEVLQLIASLISVDREDLNDPIAYPMDSILVVFEALAKHQDLLAFFASVGKLMERLPEMQTRSAAPSKP